MPKSRDESLSRRDFLRVGVVAGGVVAFLPRDARAQTTRTEEEIFRETFVREHDETSPLHAWGSDWALEGVARTKIETATRIPDPENPEARAPGDRETGVLMAATDVYPSDGRGVAFVLDARLENVAVEADLRATGIGGGVVARRVAPRSYYAALYERRSGLLTILRRIDGENLVLAAVAVPDVAFPVTLRLEAVRSRSLAGEEGAELTARLETAQGPFVARAFDSTPDLQRPGDPGLVSTIQTEIPTVGNDPVGITSARAFWGTAFGETVRNTAVTDVRTRLHEEIAGVVADEVRVFAIGTADTGPETPRVTAPNVIVAVSGVPVVGGARLTVVSDVPASRLELEVGDESSTALTGTEGNDVLNEYGARFVDLSTSPGDRVDWRVRLERVGANSRIAASRGTKVVGDWSPERSFRALPAWNGNDEVTLAIGSCATDFGFNFAEIGRRRPDVFVFEGDLNYPDSQGPLSQDVQGYAGIWKELLRTPELLPIFEKGCFAPQRDDHDYGGNNVFGRFIPDFGEEPWKHVVNDAEPRYYKFGGGLVEVFVLDERFFRDDPGASDDFDPADPERSKSLLGQAQREWLLEGLRNSQAKFKIVCTPAPVFLPANDDQVWGSAYKAERDFILRAIGGREPGIDGVPDAEGVIFVSGDSHNTQVVAQNETERSPEELTDYERTVLQWDGGYGFEVWDIRACPLGIPGRGGAPLVFFNQQEDTQFGTNPRLRFGPENASYFCWVRVSSDANGPRLDAELVAADDPGAPRWSETFRLENG